MKMDSKTKARRTSGRTLWALLALAVGLLVALPTIASARDRNNDQIPDRWEKRHGLSLKVKQTRRDQDRDNLANRREWKSGMDPLDDDSDDDGTEDGDEGAGTIASFDPATGQLVIDVFGDGQVSGLVTDDTEIECDDGDDQGDEDGDGEGDGDHSGPGDGDDDEGDDDSGPGDGDEADEESDDKGSLSDDLDEDEGDDVGDDEDDEPGDDEDEDEDCSTDDLAQNAVVQEAELEIEPGVGLVFEEIELLT